MPDLSALYPQPPQQNNSLLSGDPSRMVGLAQGVANLSLFPLQKQRLQQELQAQQIANTTAQLQQNAARVSAIANAFGTLDPKTSTEADVHKRSTYLVRQGFSEKEVMEADKYIMGHKTPGEGISNMQAIGVGASGVTAPGPEVLGPGGERTRPSMGQYIMGGSGAPVTGAPPGALEDYRDEQVRAKGYSERVNPLRQSIPILERMKETDIGPTSEEFTHFKSALQTLGLGPLAGIDPNKIADYNELKKYMLAYTSQRAQGLGPHTNEGLATAVTSNPNPKLDLMSAKQLSKMNLGIERMRQGLFREFQGEVDAGKVPAWDMNRWMSTRAQNLDPTAFVYDILDGRQQKFVRDGIKTKEQAAKWQASHDLAQKWQLLGDVGR